MAAYFPDPDEEILGRIFRAALAVDPSMSDRECGIWVRAVVPDSGIKRARGPAWWVKTLPEELAKRMQDVGLVRAFVRGDIAGRDAEIEADAIIHAGKADWRLIKALKVWLAEEYERRAEGAQR